MKTQSLSKLRQGAFTVGEMMVAVGVSAILGLIFFQVLNAGIILYAKNTAVNAAHEESRQGLNRLTRDIHAAIAVPELRSAPSSFTGTWDAPVVDPAPVSGVPPYAAGVSFQNIAGGPNYVWKDQPNNLIMIRDDPNVAVEGMRLIVPFYGLEEDMTKVEAKGSNNHRNIFIYADQSTPNIDAPPMGGTYAITYYTDRTMYLVQGGQYIADSQGAWFQASAGVYVPYVSQSGQRYRYENGEMHLYKQRYTGSAVYWQDQGIVARFISSPKPFYIPLNSIGGVNNKYVGVKLTARDPKTSNRNFLATATLLDTQIDYRSRIALYQ
jgi:hypothetical protein